jgi:hypothetical protein
MDQAKRNDQQALRDMTAFAERVKLPIQLLFSEELFRLCSEDSQPPIHGIPPLLFDILLAVACEFTNHLCLQDRHETLSLQLYPRGPEAQSPVTAQASFHSTPAAHTVTVRLVDRASARPQGRPSHG